MENIKKSNSMSNPKITRRNLLSRGGIALASLPLITSTRLTQDLFNPLDDEVIPWLDQIPENPVPEVVGNLLKWEEQETWITPNDKFFNVAHYNKPVIDENEWKLEFGGLVNNPKTFTLDELKERPRKEVIYTLECAGNHGFPWFAGGIGTAKWVGTPLAPILEEVGIREDGIEVVFFGSDAGEEEVREIKMQQQFARSFSLEDAMNPDFLLCYEMNGAPLPHENGFPVRLVTPGWYGVANVKWLQKVEVWNTRYMGRFMARDYVTIREEQQDGKRVFVESSVGRTLIKSVPGRVVYDGNRYRIEGAAWGAPIERVEVRVNDGSWLPAEIVEGQDAEYAWKLWSFELQDVKAGEYAITSRAIDSSGKIQPTMDDPKIANKKTYWESNGQITRKVRIG